MSNKKLSLKALRRSDAAVRANLTRKARRAFEDEYPWTYDIAREVLRGRTNAEIQFKCCVTVQTIAAVRANLTRWSRYADMAYDCNY